MFCPVIGRVLDVLWHSRSRINPRYPTAVTPQAPDHRPWHECDNYVRNEKQNIQIKGMMILMQIIRSLNVVNMLFIIM